MFLQGCKVLISHYTNDISPTVAPALNLRMRGVTEHTIDLEWEGSVLMTDYLVTYVATSPGGVQLEIRVPGNTTTCSIPDLEPGIEYNINVYAVLNNVISAPTNTQVSTCEYNRQPFSITILFGTLLKSSTKSNFFCLGFLSGVNLGTTTYRHPLSTYHTSSFTGKWS